MANYHFFLRKGHFSMTVEDYSFIGEDYSTAGEDYSITGEDYSMTVEDYSISGEDYSMSGEDYSITGEDYSTTGEDFSIIGEDYSTAGEDYSITGEAYSMSGKNNFIAEKEAAVTVSTACLFREKYGILEANGFLKAGYVYSFTENFKMLWKSDPGNPKSSGKVKQGYSNEIHSAFLIAFFVPSYNSNSRSRHSFFAL